MKKTISIVTICLSLSILAQQDTLYEKKNNQQQFSETKTEQKIEKELNSLYNDILNNREQTIENKNEISNLFITRLGLQGILSSLIFGLLGFFGAAYFVKRQLKNKISQNVVSLEQECQYSLTNIKEAEIRTIQFIKSAEEENEKLRNQSQILLIRETSAPKNEALQHIFLTGSSKVQFNSTQIQIKDLTFKQVENALVEENKPHPADFQLVILDNSKTENRNWNKTDIDKYIIPFAEAFLSRGIGFLYFSNDQRFPSRDSRFVNIPNRYLLNYANVSANLYNNAMTILKLQNLYKE